MYEASLYSKSNSMQRIGVINTLKRSSNLIKWEDNDVIMDVGCGPGDTTIEVLLPFLPKTFKVLYGVDLSKEMIEYAKVNNSHEKVKYFVLDIGTKNDIKMTIKEPIDHIFSFYCFHWIIDQRQLYKNLNEILNPGGDILCKFAIKSTMSDVWSILKLNKKWSGYLQDAVIILSNSWQERIESLKTILEDVGFSYKFSVDEVNHSYPNMASFIDAMVPISPWLKYIPNHLHDDIMKDFMSEAYKLNMKQKNVDKDNAHLNFYYKEVELYARKPI